MNALDDILQEEAAAEQADAPETKGESGPPPDGDMSPVEEAASRMVPIEALLDERRKR